MLNCQKPYVRTSAQRVSITRWVSSEDARLDAMPFPCGNCTPCRINNQRIWATRMVLEKLSWHESCFCTLTYRDGTLTYDDHMTAMVHPRDMTLFLKRLKHTYPDFRYFAIGEYGDESLRPHWHLMLYGIPCSKKDEEKIEDVWGNGFCTLDEINWSTDRYVALYCIKKLTREDDELLFGKTPEKMFCSRGTAADQRGGLGRCFIRDISKQIPKENGVIRGFRVGKRWFPLGRYLTKKLSEDRGLTEHEQKADLYNYQLKLLNAGLDLSGYYNMSKIVLDSKGKVDSILHWHEITKLKKGKL